MSYIPLGRVIIVHSTDEYSEFQIIAYDDTNELLYICEPGWHDLFVCEATMLKRKEDLINYNMKEIDYHTYSKDLIELKYEPMSWDEIFMKLNDIRRIRKIKKLLNNADTRN